MSDADVEYIDFDPNPPKTRKPRSDAGVSRNPSKRANTVKPTASKPRGSALQTQASGTFAKLLVITTAIFAWARIRRMQIPDPDSSIAEELAMTDDEAAPIARVLARITLSNPTSAKIVTPFVENEDLIDAGFAVWEYNKRTTELLSQYSRTITQEVPRRGSIRQDSSGPSESDGGSDPDPREFDYSAERDYRAI